MKVLHIISSGGMYGAEAVILNMSRVLLEDGHESVIGVFSNSSNPNLQLYDHAQKEGLEAHLIACRGQIDFSTVAAIQKLVATVGADVVHAHGYKADLYVYFAMRRGSIPIVSTCHTWYDNDFVVTLYGQLDRLVLRSYTRVVAVSDDVRQRLLNAGVRKDKACIVRNGIDLRPFAQVAPSLKRHKSGMLVGLIGRLAWEKGVDVFLSAAARVLQQYPGATFIVVGEGTEREKLERRIVDLKVGDHVQMLGRRDDMPAVYASLDIMVSSSRQEGLPMAILEGMATGLPLVATAVGEVPTVVHDGVTGLLVPSEDAARLADAILIFLRDPAKRKQFGAAARKLVEDEYSATRMASDYLRIYEEAIAAVKS